MLLFSCCRSNQVHIFVGKHNLTTLSSSPAVAPGRSTHGGSVLTDAVKQDNLQEDSKEANVMTTTTFDSLGYFEKLKEAGVPEAQARVQAAAFREFSAIQEEMARKELATKMDVIQAEMRLAERIENSKHEVLKWTITTVVAQTALIIAVIAFLK